MSVGPEHGQWDVVDLLREIVARQQCAGQLVEGEVARAADLDGRAGELGRVSGA
jgi:hypothetical protein